MLNAALNIKNQSREVEDDNPKEDDEDKTLKQYF